MIIRPNSPIESQIKIITPSSHPLQYVEQLFNNCNSLWLSNFLPSKKSTSLLRKLCMPAKNLTYCIRFLDLVQDTYSLGCASANKKFSILEHIQHFLVTVHGRGRTIMVGTQSFRESCLPLLIIL